MALRLLPTYSWIILDSVDPLGLRVTVATGAGLFIISAGITTYFARRFRDDRGMLIAAAFWIGKNVTKYRSIDDRNGALREVKPDRSPRPMHFPATHILMRTNLTQLA